VTQPIAELPLRRAAWWLHPAWTAMLAVLPGVALSYWTTDETFREWWRTPKYFTSHDALLMLALLGALVAGALVPSIGGGQQQTVVQVTERQRDLVARAGRILCMLTFAGYAGWLGIAVLRGLHPADLEAVFSGDSYTVRGYLAPVAGVTTLAQFAPPAVVCLLLDRRISGRRHVGILTALGAVVLIRVVLKSERLSLMELAVPAMVLWAALAGRAKGWVWALAPLCAPLLLLVVFGTFEYTRSWMSFYAQHSAGQGYAQFVLRRVVGYYATSGNNAAIVLSHLAPTLHYPYYSVRFIWNLPLLSDLWDVTDVLGYDPSAKGIALLGRYGNPEFNTMGGLPGALADYGTAGAIVWCAFIGGFLGWCHRLVKLGDLRGLVLYPVLYVGLVDLARISYWGEGRAFPAIGGAVVVAILLKRGTVRSADA
jgi:hypothetical protein